MITAPDGTMYRAADAHVHIYKEKIAAKASQVIGDFYHADGYNFEMWEPDPAPEVLLRKGKEIGIDRYAVFSAATAARQVDSINRFIADECARHPEFVGLGTAHPDAIDPTLPDGRDCEALVEQIAALGLKGMKLHPDMQQFNINDPRMMPLYRAAAQAGLVVLFHVGDERHSFSDPVRLARVLEEIPDLRCHAAHLGCCRIWDRRPVALAASVLAGADIAFDTSSMLAWAPADDVRFIIGQLGIDRIMWASDYPMWSPAEEFKLLLGLGYSSADNQRMLYDNFARFYRIDDSIKNADENA